MANVTFVSTTLPALVLEAARRLMIAERALSAPQTNVSMAFADTLVTISGSLLAAQSVEASSGNIIVALSDYTPDADPVLTGTPLAGITASSLSEVLFAALVQLDAGEALKIANNLPLPVGAGSTYSIGDGGATFTAVLPYSVSIDANGAQLISAPNYLA